MARRRRGRRSYGGRSRRRGRKGFQFPKLLDISQIVDNASGLGFITAGQQAASGQFTEAASTLATQATSPSVMLNLTFDNVLIGFSRKIIRATGGKWVRKIVA